MIFSQVVGMDTQTGVLTDFFSYILAESAGKTVLDVGAAGGVQYYLPSNKNQWLHYRLREVASDVVGLDIDKTSIEYAAQYGIDIIDGNCETIQLGRQFDIIIMADVIEHLNAPGSAIQTLANHLNPGGKILITTPNPTHYGLMVRAIMGRSLNVYFDHVCCFLPEHFKALCDRFGYRLSAIYFFGHRDKRNITVYVKSSISRIFGRIHRRWYASFMAVIEV